MENLEKAQKIVEEVLPKYFTFRLWESRMDESGTLSKLYTEKADEILNDIIKVLENGSK